MTKDEMKNKYSTFIAEISEILGLGKPIDILKLCATTDSFFQPLEKRIAELEELLINSKNLSDTIEKAQRSFDELDDRGIGDDWSIEESYVNGFSNGAEFGYNKAKVEVEESYRESLCNSELNLASITEQVEELEKANEWHYVKDGAYPTDDKKVLCILGDFENCNLKVGYYSQVKGDSNRWRFEDYDLPDDSENDWGVSAWKEIVLPELKEKE